MAISKVTQDPHATRPGSLRTIIEAYLRSVGFHSTEYGDGHIFWGHPHLGEGRTFEGALTWWMGCESEGSDKRVLV